MTDALELPGVADLAVIFTWSHCGETAAGWWGINSSTICISAANCC